MCREFKSFHLSPINENIILCMNNTYIEENYYYSYEIKAYILNDNSTNVNSYLIEASLKECKNTLKIFFLIPY